MDEEEQGCKFFLCQLSKLCSNETLCEELRMILSEVFRGIRPFSTARELCASDVYKKIKSCAVEIKTTSLDKKGDTHVVYGAGTIWDSTGIIVTCFHVIQTAVLEHAGKISVSVSHDDSTWYAPGIVITRQYDAHIVNGDPIDDIAVLRIKDPKFNLKPIKLGKLSNSPIGSDVYSIGNPFGHHSFDHGIICGVSRVLRRKNGIYMTNVIQTDCPMHKGSSGGPLFDNKGRCIGINACGFSLTCNFSIPALWVSYRVSHLMNVEGPFFALRRSTGRSYAHKKEEPFGPEESLATDYIFEVTEVGAGCSTSAA